ncbi:MAG: NUDIX hydrolase [Candidatus Pacebacteria bacterium]|nr:NUDIX hydrolase [Candidatus Paceibacterota bacterium]
MSSKNPWDVRSTRIIHNTPWIQLIEDTCVSHGKNIVYTYTRRIDEGPLIIPENENKSLWLVQLYRHPIRRVVWQFPVEGKYIGESWRDAAERGLKEELGLVAKEYIDLGEFFPDPGGLDQKYRPYIARGLSEVTGVHTSENGEVEDIQKGKFSRKEIENLIVKGEICDNWTLSALFLYDRYIQSQA